MLTHLRAKRAGTRSEHLQNGADCSSCRRCHTPFRRHCCPRTYFLWESSSSIVTVMQAAESRLGQHATQTHGTLPAGWCVLAESQMCSVLVVVAHIIGEKPLQVVFIEGNNVIQQVAPTALHPSLCNSVLPRTPGRGPDGLDGHRANCNRDFQSIFAIAVEDEKPGSRLIWVGFTQLLTDPATGGAPRDIEMQDVPPVVADDEEAVQHTKRGRGNREEVHRGDGSPMISQE